jgi:glucose/arabinose dehydrogenase
LKTRISRWRRAAAILATGALAGSLSLVALPGPVLAATVPAGFTDALVASGLTWPTGIAVANDGRVFATEQSGALRVIKNGALLPTPFIKLTVKGQGGAANEEGLVGIALDPAFDTNGFLYVYYTVPSSGNVASHNRVSRFTANGDVVTSGSEKVLLEVPGPSSGAHNGGAIHFGIDGKLYVAIGDHSNSANGQSMTTIKGKLLRINADGTIPNSNPFFNTATGQNRAIWALGLRNPYRFGVQPGTGKILINDVGNGSWEEINLGISGANYGWNLSEGPTTDPRFVSPLMAYPHQSSNGPFSGCAIVGGAFYNPTTVQFPSAYVGKYFFADYCDGWMRVLDPATGTSSSFATNAVQPVDIQTGNDGALYYLDRFAGSVRRITYASNSTAPSITNHPSNATVAEGQPASFSVSAEGTQPLTYRWQRDGVDIPAATAATYTLASTALSDSGATFRAVVTNGTGTATSNPATLTVITDIAPTVAITSPAEGTTYSAGDTINYAGTATDPEDPSIPASSFTWRIDFHHDTHFHPFLDDTSGTSGSVVTPTLTETSPNVWYRIHLTVRDSAGLTSSTYRDVLPNTVDLEFETSPPGLQVRLDGPPLATLASIEAVVGVQRTIGVVSPQTMNGQTYVFSAWAHGGAATQTIQTPAVNTTYTATYVPTAGGAFADAFDRADSTDVGNGWLEVQSGLSISTQELRNAPTKNLFQMAVLPTFSSAAQTVAASFASINGNNSEPRFGVVLRYQDPQNYYLAYRRTGGTSALRISKFVNGVETVLKSLSLSNPVSGTLFRLEGQANGTTLTLKLDGVLKLTVVDPTFTAGNVGLGLGSMSASVAGTHRADDFAASGDGAVAPSPPTLTLVASPTNVPVDGSSTLTWNTTSATGCTFTSGLSGGRPVSGSESTGALTSATSFGMTCTGAGGSVSKSVTVTVGTAPVADRLPTAEEVYASTAMNLPASVRAVVVLVPNESHHEELQRLISPTNGWLLPMKLTLPSGASVSIINADNGHEHRLTLSGTTTTFDTGTLVYGAISTPPTLAPGGYSLVDSRYSWIHGEITVSDAQSQGTLLVGAFFVPEKRIADYRNLFPANGFRIESEYLFSGGGTKHYLLIYSTEQSLAEAAPKLQQLVTANSYG